MSDLILESCLAQCKKTLISKINTIPSFSLFETRVELYLSILNAGLFIFYFLNDNIFRSNDWENM